jgi:hypothetical protein
MALRGRFLGSTLFSTALLNLCVTTQSRVIFPLDKVLFPAHLLRILRLFKAYLRSGIARP